MRVSSTTTGTANGNLSVDATSYIYTDGILDTGTYTNNGSLHAGDTSTTSATTFTLVGTAANQALISANGNAMTINATAFQLHDFNSKLDQGTANSTLTLQGTPSPASSAVGAEVDIDDTSTLSLGGGPWFFGYYQKSGANFLQRGSVNMAGGPTLARGAQINSNAYFETGVNVTAGYASLNGPEFAPVVINPSSIIYMGFSGSQTGGLHLDGDTTWAGGSSSARRSSPPVHLTEPWCRTAMPPSPPTPASSATRWIWSALLIQQLGPSTPA